MNRLLIVAAVAAGGLALTGCGNQGKEGGQPGTNDTFRISAPTTTGMAMTAPSVKRDTAHTVELTVKAESGFSGKKVSLKADAPKGLNVELNPSNVDLAGGQEAKVQLVVRAEKDAPAGEATVKVTGTPEKGNPATLDVRVKVDDAAPSGDRTGLSLSLPTGLGVTSKTIKRGASETVELTLKGESGFTGKKVSLKVDHPAAVKTELKPTSVDLAAGQEAKVQLVITPGKDAPVGEHTVRVTATADAGGAAQAREIKLKVE